MSSYYFSSDFKFKYLRDHNEEALPDCEMPIPKSLCVDDYLTQQQAKYATYKLHQKLMKAYL